MDYDGTVSVELTEYRREAIECFTSLIMLLDASKEMEFLNAAQHDYLHNELDDYIFQFASAYRFGEPFFMDMAVELIARKAN